MMLCRWLLACGLVLGVTGFASAQGRMGYAINACGYGPRPVCGPVRPGCYPSAAYPWRPYYGGIFAPYYYGFGLNYVAPFFGYPAIDPYANQYPVDPSNQPQPPPQPVTLPVGEQAPMPSSDKAEIIVHVPLDAEVWIEGVKMKQAGSQRRFISPPLRPNLTYAYEIRATWQENGREVTNVNNVRIQAGDRSSITFISHARNNGALTRASK